jgi:nucleoside-diphosphate-sugar epimerase
VKACVIGGGGFIGRRLVRRLHANGCEVVALDVKPTSFDDLGSGVRMQRLDVTSYEDVLAAMMDHRPDVLINLSYSIPLDRPRIEAMPRPGFRLDILGMDNCFEAARLAGVGHVVYASSIAVNGLQTNYGLRPILETDPVSPGNQYSTHKVFNEFQAKEYREKHGMCITGIRAAHVTGTDKMLGSVDHVLCVVKPARGEKLMLDYRDWMRSLIYVEDIAEVFCQIALSKKPRHPIYNSGGYTMALGQIVDVVRTFIPDADVSFQNETGGAEKSFAYIFNNDKLTNEFDIAFAPYEQRVQEMIEHVRREASA